METIPILEARGILTAEVRKWLQDNRIENADDLIQSFGSTEELLEDAPFLAEAWAEAAQHASSGQKLGRRPSQVLRALRFSAAMCEPIPSPPVRAWKARQRPYQPRGTGPEDVKSKDKSSRREAAPKNRSRKYETRKKDQSEDVNSLSPKLVMYFTIPINHLCPMPVAESTNKPFHKPLLQTGLEI